MGKETTPTKTKLQEYSHIRYAAMRLLIQRGIFTTLCMATDLLGGTHQQTQGQRTDQLGSLKSVTGFIFESSSCLACATAKFEAKTKKSRLQKRKQKKRYTCKWPKNPAVCELDFVFLLYHIFMILIRLYFYCTQLDSTRYHYSCLQLLEVLYIYWQSLLHCFS